MVVFQVSRAFIRTGSLHCTSTSPSELRIVENACDRAVSLAHAPRFPNIMTPVCLNPGLEQYFPPVGRSHIILSFAGIAKTLPLFLSFCVSASRHPEERPGTLSRKRALAKSIE